MKLHWSPRSPFVRKVMIVAIEKGLENRLERVRSAVMLAAPPNPDVLADNPLGKIPTLVPDDAPALFDSRVICEYLDGIGAGPRLIPEAFDDRITCLRWQAFGDGLTDIFLLWRTEMARGEQRSEVISDSFDAKVHASLARLETEADALRDTAFGLGHVAIVCAIGQLDFRFPDSGWKAAHPRLSAWYAEMQERPSVAETAIADDGAAAMGDVAMPLRFEAAA